MHFVYQKRRPPTKKRQKKGKMLESMMIHIMDGEKTVCGLATTDAHRANHSALLYRLSDEQVKVWLFSQQHSKSFDAEMCYTCTMAMKQRLKYRGNKGVPNIIKEVIEQVTAGET